MENQQPLGEHLFSPNLPIVHSITSTALVDDGWEKHETTIVRNTQTFQTIYTKGELKIISEGGSFILNGQKLQFMEDINKQNNGE